MTQAALTVNVRAVRGVTILDLKGGLVMGDPVELVHDKIKDLLDQGAKNLAINLAGVVYMDSMGTGTLVAAFASCMRADATLKAFAAPPDVLSSMKLTRLDVVLDLAPDEASCLSSFRSK